MNNNANTQVIMDTQTYESESQVIKKNEEVKTRKRETMSRVKGHLPRDN